MSAVGGRIEVAGREDVAELAELWLELARHHARFEPLFELRPDAAGEVRSLLLAQLRDPDQETWLWREGDAALAYLSARVDQGPPIYRETRRAEILDLYVAEPARRRGIGRALVETACAWARQRGVVRVEVRVAAGNREGQAFWRVGGFADLMDVLHRPL